MKKIKYLTILLLLLISPISVKADIIDFNKKGTITIELIESTDNTKVSDAEITIYKLADAIDLNNNLSFKFISELNECRVNLMELKEVTTELNDCIKDIRYSNMKDFHSLAHLFDHSRKLHFSFAIFIIFSHNIII